MNQEGFLIWLLGTVFLTVLSLAAYVLERNRFVEFVQPVLLFIATAWCLGIPVVYVFKVLSL